jgi:hypothetical protein
MRPQSLAHRCARHKQPGHRPLRTAATPENVRDHSANVKRWRDGTMALRWCAAGMNEAAKQFRRVNGFMHLPALRAALDRHVAQTVTPPEYHQNKEVAA